MTQAQPGTTVKVHYTGKLEDGTVFDSSVSREPLEFTLGTGQVIPGFEQAVAGLSPGESKTITIPAEEAYGPRRDEMVLEVDRQQFPEHIDPQVGMQLQVPRADGGTAVARITDVSEAQVTLDANHPLAGQDLTFELELVGVE